MNKKEALLCASIAQSAYTNRSNEADFQMTAKFENKGTDTQGLMGVAYDNTFVVAFRGSEETGIADWLTDLKFILNLFPYGKDEVKDAQVHQGFISAYNSVRDAVLDAVRKTPHKRVICTGHSLGAALATLCALDIRCNVSGKEVSCYTYGSPKVGDDNFVKAYNRLVANTFRFVYRSDVVPSMPPGSYNHVGQFQQLGQQSETFSLSAILDNVIDKLEDHLPQNYVKALRDML